MPLRLPQTRLDRSGSSRGSFCTTNPNQHMASPQAMLVPNHMFGKFRHDVVADLSLFWSVIRRQLDNLSLMCRSRIEKTFAAVFTQPSWPPCCTEAFDGPVADAARPTQPRPKENGRIRAPLGHFRSTMAPNSGMPPEHLSCPVVKGQTTHINR